MPADAPTLAIDGDRLMADLHALRRFGADPRGGLTRYSFSPVYGEAAAWLRHRMAEAGLEVRVDAVGNVIGRLGPAGPAVLSGSHIDTVPSGGWLDGAYGVLAALECARVLSRSSQRRAFEVVAFIDEEGAYVGLLGSRAMVGDIHPDEIEAARGPGGQPLARVMTAAGLDPAGYRSAARSPADIAAYIELHIEQGPVLESSGTQIGIVEGIVGIATTEFLFAGSADHAGTAPMDMRTDAFRAAADFVAEANRSLADWGTSATRMTFGICEILPGASNVVPRQVRLVQDVRDPASPSLERVLVGSERLARRVAASHGVDVGVRRLGLDAPAMMSSRLRELIETVCRHAGYSARSMPSGASHDAQVMSRLCEAGMIFVPSCKGASHRPDESTDEADLERGANVLLGVLERLLNH